MRFPILLAPCAAVIALLAPPPAAAQSLEAARTFTTGLYRAYEGDRETDYLGRRAPSVFAPDLLALIRQDMRATPPGDVGVLDGDPICGCQDADGLRLGDMQVVQVAQGRASAHVKLRFPSETVSMTLDLVALRGRWLVADVHRPDMPSLVKFLTDGVKLEWTELARAKANQRYSGIVPKDWVPSTFTQTEQQVQIVFNAPPPKPGEHRIGHDSTSVVMDIRTLEIIAVSADE